MRRKAMSNTSNKAVQDYLSNMSMDLTMSDPETVPDVNQAYEPQDSIDTGYKMVPCMDPFSLMGLETVVSPENIWLAYLSILNLSSRLPEGHLKQYCLRQCQTLNNQLIHRSMH